MLVFIIGLWGWICSYKFKKYTLVNLHTNYLLAIFLSSNMSTQPVETWCSVAGNMFICSYIPILAGYICYITIFAASIPICLVEWFHAEGHIPISLVKFLYSCYLHVKSTCSSSNKRVCLNKKTCAPLISHDLSKLQYLTNKCPLFGQNMTEPHIYIYYYIVGDIDPHNIPALSPLYPISGWLKLKPCKFRF